MSSLLSKTVPHESTTRGLYTRQHVPPKPLPKNTNLTSQLAIITGSNIGVGLSASRQLLSLNLSHLIMGVRTFSKGENAASTLRADFPNAKIEVWEVDMEKYDHVQAFAKRVSELERRVDIVVLNAGLFSVQFVPVKETGHETMLQVNYLSTALLATLLVPILKQKAKLGGVDGKEGKEIEPPVLAVVSSDAHYAAKISTSGPIIRQLNRTENFERMERYSQSKLLLTLYLIKLASLTNPDEVLITIANPGLTSGTSFSRGLNKIEAFIFGIFLWMMARKVDVGASAVVDAVVGTARNLSREEVHGSFLSEWGVRAWPGLSYSEEGKQFSERLWEETMEELRLAGFESVVNGLRVPSNVVNGFKVTSA